MKRYYEIHYYVADTDDYSDNNNKVYRYWDAKYEERDFIIMAGNYERIDKADSYTEYYHNDEDIDNIKDEIEATLQELNYNLGWR